MDKFLYQNKILENRRKELRNNQTKEEILLWGKIRRSKLAEFKFTRQYSAGPYILDFYCPKLRLAIELDGNAHKDKEAIIYDKDRDNYLKSINILTLRFWNSEVRDNMENVIERITKSLASRSATSPLSIRGD